MATARLKVQGAHEPRFPSWREVRLLFKAQCGFKEGAHPRGELPDA